ncbi:MAG: AzlD domain-containing protein [Bdellovibrionales bacterium]|nr:AzlD domain-containing protein [Bdellovibrionales bacterium]
MNDHYFWYIVGAMAFGTLAIRGSIIAISSKIKISERTKEIFSFIPAAVLPAIATPAVFFHVGKVEWLFGKERLVVAILALVLSTFFRSMLGTLGFGMVALYLLTST